jgi:protein-disulfide isomerase
MREWVRTSRRLKAQGAGHTMLRKRRLVFTVLLLAAPLVVAGQTPSPGSVSATSPSAGRDQSNEILNELRSIRQLLEGILAQTPKSNPTAAPVPPRRVTLSALRGESLGRSDAPLTMVEFSDLQCPFCRQYLLSSFDEIKRTWIDPGKLRYISRDYPLDFHAQARNASVGARCAGEQGKYWEMRVLLGRNAAVLSPEFIAKAADELGLQKVVFGRCTGSPKHSEAIAADVEEARSVGISGTPSFVIGKTTSGTFEGYLIVGALPYNVFQAKLSALLEER